MKLFNLFILTILSLFSFVFSQNLKELQKLQDEYKRALERQALQKPKAISDAENTAKSTALPDKLIYSRKDIESLLVNTEKLLIELKSYEDSVNNMPYVGYDFFTKRDTIPFWQNLPLSNNYTLGPGDEVIISLWGESSAYSSEVINRDGQIFVKNIGILNLDGKTIFDAKKYIVSKYSRVYSTLLGESPKSFIDLTLGELKSVNVHFVGFVNIPGVHMLHPFSNVITGLIQAGGVDNKGTLRDIKILRNNEVIESVDIYNYLIKGKSVSNIRLMDQDVVYVSSRKSTVPVTGQVLMPGYYEILENESLGRLINFAGGIGRWHSENIFIYKNSNSDKNGYIIDKNQTENFFIANGDSIHVAYESQEKKFVNIQGQVKNPGQYPFNKNTKLSDILSATNSLKDKDFYQTMDLSRISVYRKNPSNERPLTILTNFSEDFLLKNGDLINIPKNNLFQPIESVVITGEIKTPGSYPVNNLTNLEEIISLSGGLTDFALYEGIQIFRDSMKIAWDKDSFILKNGDSLNVMKKTGLVLVKGEVNVPGYVSFKKSDSIKKYINKAGGFTSFAEKNNIYIVYPNGTSAQLSQWRSPKVKEGSTIIVNQRMVSASDNITGLEIFTSLTSQAGAIATTLLSLSLLINQGSSGN